MGSLIMRMTGMVSVSIISADVPNDSASVIFKVSGIKIYVANTWLSPIDIVLAATARPRDSYLT